MSSTHEWHLRPASEDDLEALYEILCVPDVYRYLADGAAPPRLLLEQWLQRSHSDFARHGFGLWVLEDGYSQIGGCVRLEMREEPRCAELTYLLHPQFWGQGLATRMSWTAMQLTFRHRQVDEVVAGTDEPNSASVAVMRRLGMEFLHKVQYPLGPGVEYVFRRTGPVPVRPPSELPLRP